MSNENEVEQEAERRRRYAAIDAMAIASGLIPAPRGYDLEAMAREGGMAMEEVQAIVAMVAAEVEAEEIWEAIEEACRDLRRH